MQDFSPYFSPEKAESLWQGTVNLISSFFSSFFSYWLDNGRVSASLRDRLMDERIWTVVMVTWLAVSRNPHPDISHKSRWRSPTRASGSPGPSASFREQENNREQGSVNHGWKYSLRCNLLRGVPLVFAFMHLSRVNKIAFRYTVLSAHAFPGYQNHDLVIELGMLFVR